MRLFQGKNYVYIDALMHMSTEQGIVASELTKKVELIYPPHCT
jgi:hypothetical protein